LTRSIVHAVSTLQIGGAERFVIDLCAEQKKNGWHPTILSYGTTDDPLVDVCHKAGISVLTAGQGRLKQFSTAFVLLRSAVVVHIHSPGALRPLSVILPFLGRRTVIYTRHGADPLVEKRWKLVHQVARLFVDVVTFVSSESATVFHRQHGWSHHRSQVIENGVSIPEKCTARTRNEEFHIGIVGRMVPLKRHITLLEAMKHLAPKERDLLKIHLFGDGECKEELQHFHDQHLRSMDVRFYGNITDRSMIYSNLDLLIVTSQTEGLSIAILEAMAQGIPVFATRVGGNERLVQDNITGRLFDYDDSTTLSQLLVNTLRSPELLTTWGENARQHVATNFSLRKTAKEYDEIYIK